MKTKNKIILGGFLILVAYVLISAPKTLISETKAADNVDWDYNKANVKYFYDVKEISLKNWGRFLPDQKFSVHFSGKCFYDGRQSKLEINDAFYLKPILGSVERFDVIAYPFNRIEWLSSGQIGIGYHFLSHSRFPVSPFRGHETIQILCGVFGQVEIIKT